MRQDTLSRTNTWVDTQETNGGWSRSILDMDLDYLAISGVDQTGGSLCIPF
jgi:hypothetical protein